MTPNDSAAAARRLFWRTFNDWLAGAEPADLDALARTLEPFGQDVRPLNVVMDQVLLHPEGSATLPKNLVQALTEAGYVLQPVAQAEQAPKVA